MKRTRLIAAIAAAAALTLAGCSSPSTGTPEGVEGASDTAAGSPDGDSSEASETSSESTAADDAVPEESSTGGDVTPVDLDPQSVAWFSEFCGISAPFNEFLGAMMSSAMVGVSGEQVDSAKLVEARTALATAFEDLGQGMNTVGSKLAAMDPPAIDGGPEIAQQVIKGMTAGGPAMGQIAEQVSQVSTADAETFTNEVNAVMDSMDGLQDQLGIGDLKVDDSVKAAVATLPACQGSMLFSDSF